MLRRVTDRTGGNDTQFLGTGHKQLSEKANACPHILRAAKQLCESTKRAQATPQALFFILIQENYRRPN